MTNREYADGLRAIADWFEAHTEIPAPPNELTMGHLDERDEAMTLVRALGSCEKSYSDDLLIIARRFGPLKLRFLFYRSSVCTKHVIGTEEVAEHVVPAHTKEIVEWDCHPLLAPEP